MGYYFQGSDKRECIVVMFKMLCKESEDRI